MSSEISWHVELVIKPGQLKSFRELTREMVKSTKRESGVLIYERYLSQDEEVVHVVERYEDSAAAVRHLEAFRGMYGARFSALVDRRRFLVFGSPDDELRKLLDNFSAIYVAPFDGFSRLHEGSL